MEKGLPRGLRNNNPLNIRIGNKWQGEVENPTDSEFEQFKCIHYGLRAGFLLIKRYIQRYHLNTLAEVIHRWAPASENNTQRYIEVVSDMSGIGVLDKLDFDNEQQMCNMVNAMVFVECGQTIPMALIKSGYIIAKEGL